MVQASLQVCVMPPTRKRCVQCSLYGLPTCSHCLCNGCTFCQKRIDQMEQDICGQTREGSGGQRCRSCRRSRVKRTDAKREEICLPVQPTQPLPPRGSRFRAYPANRCRPPGCGDSRERPIWACSGNIPGSRIRWACRSRGGRCPRPRCSGWATPRRGLGRRRRRRIPRPRAPTTRRPPTS